MLLVIKQILPVGTIGNVKVIVWRTCILIAFFFNLFYLQINKYIKKSKRWLVNVLKIFNISDQI